MSCDLFEVEDEDVFDSVDGGKQRAVKRPYPADGLSVDDLQHVLRDGELLLTPPLGQAAVAVIHDDPETTRKLSETRLTGILKRSCGRAKDVHTSWGIPRRW